MSLIKSLKELKNRFVNRHLAKKQADLIESVEGIGDVLSFETARVSKNKFVLQGMNELNDVISDFLDIQENEPDKFMRLLLAEEYFDLYKANEKEARFRLELWPEEYLIAFSTSINQLLRIHREAVDASNGEIARQAAVNLNRILAKLARVPRREIIVKQVLNSVQEVLHLAIKANDTSAYVAAIHWYTGIVFDSYGDKNKRFQFEYLQLFDSYYFSTIRLIISEGKTKIFQMLVAHFTEGIHIDREWSSDVWEYGHILLQSNFDKFREINEQHGVDKQINELVKSIADIHSEDNAKHWLEKFDQLKQCLIPHITGEPRKKADELEVAIKSKVDEEFKFNNLLEIIFALGAFCLLKEKYSYIRYLWEYKQPPDSDAVWCGHDIVPESLPELIQFYFRKGVFERRPSFWEGHRGSEGYYKNYFLLLLCYVLRRVNRGENVEGYPEIENFNLPKLSIYRLSDIEHSHNELLKNAEALKLEREMFLALGFGVSEIQELLEEKLIPFLRILGAKATSAIESIHRHGSISVTQVAAFKEQFKEEFHKTAWLRRIFNYFGAYVNKVKETEKSDAPDRLGIYKLDEKAVFFDEWHVSYSDWGRGYARNMAHGEDTEMLRGIIRVCEGSNEDLESVLNRFEELTDAVILANHKPLFSLIERSVNFKPKWHKDENGLNVEAFEGWYSKDDVKIPVFRIYHATDSSNLLILNKKRMGKLVQLNPLNLEEGDDLLDDIFSIEIEELSANDAVLRAVLDDAPEWLVRSGNEAAQREILKEKVFIRLSERIAWEPGETFEGYLIRYNED